jgi:ferredoxin--NADP+ reductase
MTVHEPTRRLDAYDTSTRHLAVVIANTRLTAESAAEVRELVLDVEAELDARPGQSIGIVVPGPTPFGQKEHFRLYTIADLPERTRPGTTRLRICVRRVDYLDAFSGERYPGRASSFLCSLAPGARLRISGPYGLAFEVPADRDARLVLIGAGTGIAPFRAFVRHLFREVPDWRGRVWLFHGAPSGLELLYQNDERDDFAQYVDRATFEAFQALSPRPSWADPIAWDYAIEARSAELWEMLQSARTWVYVAGHEPALADLDRVLARVAGSPEEWARRKAELRAGGRWVELVY